MQGLVFRGSIGLEFWRRYFGPHFFGRILVHALHGPTVLLFVTVAATPVTLDAITVGTVFRDVTSFTAVQYIEVCAKDDISSLQESQDIVSVW